MNRSVYISEDNAKGVGPSVSLRPVADCTSCRLCARSCYARRLALFRPIVRESWEANSTLARKHIHAYFWGIQGWLQWRRPETFRWHAAGDILSQYYLDCMIEVARMFPGTAFLAMTKRHCLDYSQRPENLSIVLSFWPGMRNPPPRNATLPRAYVGRDSFGNVEKRAVGATPCPGRCDNCRLCWRLRAGESVVFELR